MGNLQIKLDNNLYKVLVNGIRIENNKLDYNYDKLELTGNMPSMSEIVCTMDALSNIIKQCNLMCEKLVDNLDSVAEIINIQDNALAGSK